MNSDLTPYVPRLLLDWQHSFPHISFRSIEGTLAFVDMSGFTKMSERLAKQGKVGAEEVTDMINAIFTRLLDIAWRDGGGLVKFGGDALLLVFDGEDHAARACHATASMRVTLREFSRTKTSAGLVSLRMSAGVHSGTFDLFLAGTRHRELVITGPASTMTVEMESTAVAGEIVISPQTAAALATTDIGKAKGAGFILKRAPIPASLNEPSAPTGGVPDLTSFIPLVLRKRIGLASGHGEHRQVTCVFIHFGGIDAIMASEGAPAVYRRLESLLAAVQEEAFEYDLCFLATDIDRDGGKIILTAGAPESFENDEERALRVARAIIERDYGLPLRIGVNRGRVFAGEIGPAFRRTYTVMGDAVNLAARLMGAARPRQVVTTADVLDRSRTRFASQPLGPLFLKGKSQPIEAYAVGEAGTSREVAHDHLPLVGREREIQALLAALASAARGEGRLVQLVGEPGLGKSRLVQELRDASGGHIFLSTACEQYESSTPYFAFRALLRGLLEIPSDLGPEQALQRLRRIVDDVDPGLDPWLPLLALPLDLATSETEDTGVLDPAFRRTGVHRAVERLLERLLAQAAVIVFEDVHWMDEASRDLLHYLATGVPSRPWLICVTRRDQDLGFVPDASIDHFTIRLAPLSSADSLKLTEAASEEAPLPPHVMAALTERAAGNPLFLQQLISASLATGGDALPDSVEAAITARIDRLAPGDRGLLRYASVIGQQFNLSLLFRMVADWAGPASRASTWHHLSEFIEEDAPDSFRFKHSLYREVAYEGLPYRERGALHAQIGTVLEHLAGARPDEVAEILSLHFFRAQRFDKSWRYSRAAGERARAKFANVEAAEFLRRAIDSAKRLGNVGSLELAQVWEALGDVSELAGLYSQAGAAYRSGRALAGQAGVSPAVFFLKEGVVRDRLGLYTQALRWYGRGLRYLAERENPADSVRHRIQFSLATAAALYRQSRHHECIRWCKRAITDASAVSDRASLARAYYLLDNAYTDLGRPESAQYRALALPVYEELGDLVGQANVLNNLGIDAYYESRWDEALSLYRRSKDARDKAGDTIGAATSTNNIAEILSDQGRLEEAEPLFKEALRIWRAAGYSIGVALATSNLGRLAARAGRPEDAALLLADALTEFERIGADNFAFETSARIAENLVFQGQHGAARCTIDDLLSAAGDTVTMVLLKALVQRLSAQCAVQAGENEDALAAFEESLRLARSIKADYEAALTLHAMAALSQATAIAVPGDPAAEALTIFQRLGVVRTPVIPQRQSPSRGEDPAPTPRRHATA
ncbi:MAG TPA: adenylate/guanylate cyclase domain-containing protein [Dehalococcoidia bacterium]|nr:adenylate/guanylate cyclase domain-containing protein [Dehalococcoidia bacterium]